MPRAGGTYSLPALNPVVEGTDIEPTWANNTLNDIAAALTASLAKDGQTVPTANLPMGTNIHTGVGAATSRTHYGQVAQVQDGAYNLAGSVAGADTITGSLSPAIAAYANGMAVVILPAENNTGGATLGLNGLTARSIVDFAGNALAADALVAGIPVTVLYDLANTRWILQKSPTHANLTALSSLSLIADRLPYANGTGTLALATFTAAARNLLDDADASTMRSTLGLGSLAVLSSVNNDNWSGADLAVANGGTGASDDSGARTALGLAIGTNVQAWDANLDQIAALAVTDSNFIVGNGSAWVAESSATARTSLGLGSIATQAASNVAITGGAISGITDLAVADGGTGASDAANARSNLGVGSMATRAVTISTGDPSGGADGDVWLKYTA